MIPRHALEPPSLIGIHLAPQNNHPLLVPHLPLGTLLPHLLRLFRQGQIPLRVAVLDEGLLLATTILWLTF